MICPHKLRYYTPDDYVNDVPCIFMYRGKQESVFPIEMSGKNKFDDGRKLTFKFLSGHVRTVNIGGGDLTQVLYAATK